MGYRLIRLDDPVLIVVSKPLLTEIGDLWPNKHAFRHEVSLCRGHIDERETVIRPSITTMLLRYMHDPNAQAVKNYISSPDSQKGSEGDTTLLEMVW